MIDLESDLKLPEDARKGRDDRAADREMKRSHKGWTRPDGYTWHHQQVTGNGKGQMILVDSRIHSRAKHYGAFAAWTAILESRKLGQSTRAAHALRRLLPSVGWTARRGLRAVGVFLTFNNASNAWAVDGAAGAGAAVARDIVFAAEVEMIGGFVIDEYLDPLDKAIADLRKGYERNRFGALADDGGSPEFREAF